ncbi:MAG TPA: glycosyltransferase family 1 protein [Chlorobaculum sp.]|nr:glycosyltransferase family 1 protein [Chlorobaculum sp.]
MRIGIDFTHNLGHSGIGTYSRELAKSMAVQSPGDEIHILTRFKKAQLFAVTFESIANVQVREEFPNMMMLGENLMPLTKKIRSAIWKRESRKNDVVHFTDPHPMYFCSGLPNAVSTIHDIIPLYNKAYSGIDPSKLKLFKTHRIIRESRQIIVPSNFVKDELRSFLPESNGKISVIYEAAKSLYKKKMADRSIIRLYGVHDDKPFYLYVGRIEKRKNMEKMLQAFRMMPEPLRRDTGFVLICNGSEREVNDLHRLVDDLGLSGSVFHLQGVPDEHLVHFYNEALALLFVSFSEGFGLPLVEAMSCGCPSIISNISSLPEVANGSALLADPSSVEQISHCMCSIYEDSSLRDELSRKALNEVRRFSWDIAARETLDVYRKAIQ